MTTDVMKCFHSCKITAKGISFSQLCHVRVDAVPRGYKSRQCKTVSSNQNSALRPYCAASIREIKSKSAYLESEISAPCSNSSLSKGEQSNVTNTTREADPHKLEAKRQPCW